MSAPVPYRWNQSHLAAAYDADASRVHPYYTEVQDAILALLAPVLAQGDTVVDLGAGSGRLMERVLERYPGVGGVLVDQSEPFLDLARRRLERFGDRAAYVCSRLQADWTTQVPGPVAAIVSMSAIHHLEPGEKQACYRQACESLRPGGLFANGDEVRPESNDDYLAETRRWADHMQRLIDARQVSEPMAGALRAWQDRNVARFHEPKSSGDDCHETAATQLAYLRTAGFAQAGTGWSRELWTVLVGRKS
jgi:tRNA (cmo5U34)-methyltransferase